MARIAGLLVTVILLNVAMFVFTFNTASTSVSDYNTESGNSSADSQDIWGWLTNPTTSDTSTFWTRLFSASAGLLAIGFIAAVVGLYFTRDINIWYIGLAVYIAAFTIGTYARFWTLVNNSFLLGGNSGKVMVMVLVGAILAVQLFSLLDWGRAKD